MALISAAVIALVLVAGGITVWLARPHDLDTGAVASTIGNRLGATVRCPARESRTAGTSFQCTAHYADGRTVRLAVTVRSDAGEYHWQVLSGGR